VAGERPVPVVDLDEGLRVPDLEVQDEETIVECGIAARRLSLVGDPDEDQSLPDWNARSACRVTGRTEEVSARGTA